LFVKEPVKQILKKNYIEKNYIEKNYILCEKMEIICVKKWKFGFPKSLNHIFKICV